MAGVDEPEMTPDEFKARQRAGLPVQVFTSREAFRFAAGVGVTVVGSAIVASDNVTAGIPVAAASSRF